MTSPGTTLPVGSDAPPTTPAKAWAALLWGLVPVLGATVIAILTSLDVLWPDAPGWVKVGAPILVALLGPVLSTVGAYKTPNKLLQTVTIP